MRARTGFVIGVAAGLAVVPFVWKPKPATATVAAVVRDVPAGTALSREDVALREIPVTLATQSLVWPADLDAAVGRTLRHGLRTGDLMRMTDFTLAVAAMKPGQRAMTLDLEERRALMGSLAPGDHVDVLGVLTDAAGEKGVRTIVDDLEVLEVVHRTPPEPTSVTLSGNADAIQTLLLTSEVTKPWLTVRANGDGDCTRSARAMTTIRTLLGQERGHDHGSCRFSVVQVKQ